MPTAHVGKQRAVAGAGTIRGASSKRAKQASTAYCTVLDSLHYKSVMSGLFGYLVSLLLNRVGLLSNGVGLFSREM